MVKKFELCYECGNKMYRDVKKTTLSYKENEVEVDQPGWYCSGCDESLLTGEDIKSTEPAFVRLKALAENLFTPEEIQGIRKRLNLSQREAGSILGGGARAFYKYEHGLSMVSRPMHNQLKLLSINPEMLNELRPD